jgi:hypothetical protein
MKPSTLAPLGLLLLAATAYADTAVYDLDVKNAREIAAAINNTLHAQCVIPQQGNAYSSCRAELLSTGQLLVEAPPQSQSQIAAVLKAIAAHNAEPTPRVTLQYWVIYGEPGKPDAAGPALKPLGAVLQQLERTHGELGFSVEDTASVTSQSGTTAKYAGGPLGINQTARATGDTVDLAAELSFHRPPVSETLRVDVTIKQGEFLVLAGRAAPEPGADKPDTPPRSGMLFYVVHWPRAQ